MKQTSILITGVGARSVGYQLVECLRNIPLYRIVAVDVDAFSAGLYKSQKSYLVPLASDDSYIPKIIQIAKQEKIKAILPGSQQELVIIAKHEKDFIEAGIIPIVNQYHLIKTLANKILQYELLQKYGFLVPLFITFDELPKELPFNFPCIAKPSVDHAGSRNAYIIKDYDELKIVFERTRETNTKMLLQEYVGIPEEEYTVGVVVDREKEVIDAIVMKRNLKELSLLAERTINGKRYAISSGISQGIFIKDDQIKNYCIKIAKSIGARGPLNVQLRRSLNRIYVFEIHARFSGSASLRAAIGFNEPDALIKNFIFQKKLSSLPHQLDVAVIRHLSNIVVPAAQLEELTRKGKISH